MARLGILLPLGLGSAWPAMDVKIREFLDSVGSFFTGGDHIPWSDRDIIAGCEREVTESGTTETKNEGLMRLSWALVHSRHSEDVNRGTM
ncbi:hypothetical protein ZIOFF_003367 [Zingiber officinale]|uniref:Uncharacterized protein n=1 Tax=Zingiber officinale TaxID=94328 RepID=A0A8J5I8K2_ZINOF|nr:hypothetical protein ZIOFF_003367 [Zingiber officinale]